MASPKKSYQDKLGWFFGPGISSLDPTRAPVEYDVVKLCIHIFDENSSKASNENEIINIVKDVLIHYFKSRDEHAILINDNSISTKIKRILNYAKKYDMRLHKTTKHFNDQVWIRL